jgi:hypothetical protein
MTKEEAFQEWTQTDGPWYKISVDDQRAIFAAGWEACLRYVVNTPNENVEAPKMVMLSEGFEDPRDI